MSQVKKILITLPEHLLSKAEEIASLDKIPLNDFILAAMEHFIDEKKKNELREQLIRGYQDMSEINLKIAEDFLYSDNDAMLLSESDNK